MAQPRPQVEAMFRLVTTVVGVGLWGLLMLGYFLLVYRPLTHSVINTTDEADRIEMLLTTTSPIVLNHQRLTKELRDLESRIAVARDRVPLVANESQFMNDVNHLASELHVELLDYRRGEAKQMGQCQELEVSLRCLGEYGGLCRLLHAIEHLPRLTSVRSLEIETADVPGEFPLSVTYVLYYGLATDPANAPQVAQAATTEQRQ